MGINVELDKEYAALESMGADSGITQRKLSERLGISLGSVNILLNKMQREGLIKIKNMPKNRVAYLLTPKGLAEKAEKTYKYVTYHYKRINETKEKIKEYLTRKFEEEEKIYLLADDTEMYRLVMLAAEELGKAERVRVVRSAEEIGKIEAEDALLLLLKDDGERELGGRRTERVLESI